MGLLCRPKFGACSVSLWPAGSQYGSPRSAPAGEKAKNLEDKAAALEADPDPSKAAAAKTARVAAKVARGEADKARARADELSENQRQAQPHATATAAEEKAKGREA